MIKADCVHVSTVREVAPRSEVCEACAREGSTSLALRVCMECGHVGCCDSSPKRHARRHFEETGHPIIIPLVENPNWRWCYIDDTYI
ncbi:hypothetical protein EPN42_04150 [bacterium]|nr:MAG: hypothetical protein EPN42_04150 [bacterium]